MRPASYFEVNQPYLEDTTNHYPFIIKGYDETPWYRDDLFGLKTLDLEKGNLYFNTTDGDHLEFSTDYLLDLVGLYFK